MQGTSMNKFSGVMEIAVLLLVVKDLPGVAGWKRLEIVHTARRKPPQQIKGNFK